MPKKEPTQEEMDEEEEEINEKIKEITDEMEKQCKEDKGIPAKMKEVELPKDPIPELEAVDY